MLRSFAESSTADTSRWFLVSDDSVTPVEQRELLAFARGLGIRAEPLRVPDELMAGFDEGDYPRIVWYRAALAEVLPEEDRLLYLDSDVLVLHDLRALWDTDLGDGKLFGAVCHPSYGGGERHLSLLGMPGHAPYFNSGVMLMNLALMRSEGFTRRTREFAVDPGRPSLRFPEQDAMNVLFSGRWIPLDPAWNCMSAILLPHLSGARWTDDIHHEPHVLERAARSPAVVHFEGPNVLRPWTRGSVHPFADLYRAYRASTPWPLTQLEGRHVDTLFSWLPPRLQGKLWQLRRRRAGLS